ncbi:hypothetical protein P3W85_44145 [Cupriavidus basilensis]|uniref:Uncharacterized protein n=1 Tax=Cupriavidus basilensis TaxID=68895 RepID=A0ABT6B4R8_9BURK|nr:DUF6781 family protein [Cupriavidus basilensis]MDF3839879.1 hypothetical protein [Cupriavidus basilensis]
MIKSGIDQDALIEMFSQATVKQGEALRKAVSEAMLKALHGRELSLKNIRSVLQSVTEAASIGAAKNGAQSVDVEAMLAKALTGMDTALLHAVEANRKALQQFIDHGAGLRDKQLKVAMNTIEKFEDTLFASVGKTIESADSPVKGAWEHALGAMKLKGSETGAQATHAVELLMAQTKAALREGRATSVRATQVLLDSYAAVVSGVLIGMSEGLQAPLVSAAPKSGSRRQDA